MAKGHKYEPLAKHLRDSGSATLELNFDQISQMVGGLPESATKFPQWWENTGHHSQSKAWLGAGYRVDGVDREARRATFRRKEG
jgi:hypothetical protein